MPAGRALQERGPPSKKALQRFVCRFPGWGSTFGLNEYSEKHCSLPLMRPAMMKPVHGGPVGQWLSQTSVSDAFRSHVS